MTEPVKIGVTATRRGLTRVQIDVVAEFLGARARGVYGPVELHHGDCVGGDAAACVIARDVGYRLVSHPPAKDVLRAFVSSDEEREPAPYLVRNRAIVDEVMVLLALPDGPERQQSGTWATVRYAREVGRPYLVVGPSGPIEERLAGECTHGGTR